MKLYRIVLGSQLISRLSNTVQYRTLSGTPEARAAYIARETRSRGDLDALTAATPALLEELAPLLAELEGLVRAPGTDVGESDFQLYPLLRSLSIVKALRFGPKVTAYYDAMGAACALEDFSAQAQ